MFAKTEEMKINVLSNSERNSIIKLKSKIKNRYKSDFNFDSDFWFLLLILIFMSQFRFELWTKNYIILVAKGSINFYLC